MAASVSLAVDAVLTAAFSSANAPLEAEDPNRISVYRALIPGKPTDRYTVIYAGLTRGSSSLNGIGNDGRVKFQVTCAATYINRAYAADICDWLVTTTLDALVGAKLAVTGWSPFIVEQDEIETFQVPVEVVPGRSTVEQALWFHGLSDRITQP
jgi:hypothetical protein